MNSVRVFWKCRTAGCRTHAVTDLEIIGRGAPIIKGESEDLAGSKFGIHDWDFLSGDRKKRPAILEVYRQNGLVCETHEIPMAGNILKAKFNPLMECSAKCVNARRSSCECSCRGQNHGAGNVA